MLSFVIVVALVNLALGYLVAMLVADPSPLEAWLPARPAGEQAAAGRSSESLARCAAPLDSAATDAAPPQPTLAEIEELPADWLQELTSSGIVAKSYVEATAHVVRLKVGRYREQLLAAESRARAYLAAGESRPWALLVADLATIHDDWLQRQDAAARMLRERSGRFGDDEGTAMALEQSMLDQAALIRDVSQVLTALDFSADVENCGKQLLARIATLVDAAHSLRDGMQDHLAVLVRAGQRFESLGANVLRDPVSGLPNRVGAEAVLAAWWQDDPGRARPLSVALIDIDRFAAVNQRLGTRAGDRALAALGTLLEELIRRERGFDKLARFAGQRFLILLGDTGPQNGLAALERIRQAIEATTFDDQGAEFELSISGGVVEAGPRDSAADLLRRAVETLRFAKKAGRNRCAIHDGKGPMLKDAPQFHVQGQVIALSAE